MKRVSLGLAAFVAVGGLALAGCNKEGEAAGGGGGGGGGKAAAGGIGVAACDDYVAKYSKCVEGKVPEAARAQVKAGMDTMVKAWTDAAKTPEGKAGLEAGCKAALDSAKTAMASYGCEW